MNHIFIINPTSGSGEFQPKIQQEITNVCTRNSLKYQIYYTKGVSDATDFCKKVLENRKDDEIIRFYAVGGDGTLNEVVNGMAHGDNCELTVIPCGTGNDFIKSFQNEKAFFDIEKLVNSKSKNIDLIRVNDKYCINICSIGFDADVANNVNKFRKVPFISGALKYYLAVAVSLFRPLCHYCKMAYDNEPYLDTAFTLAAVCNGICYGGGFYAGIRAKLNDGYFDVCAVKKINLLLFSKLIGIYKRGEHVENEKTKDFITYRKCKKFVLKSDEHFRVNLDGEISQVNSVNFEICENKIKFAAPEFIDL